MAVVSIEVPDSIANKFDTKVIKYSFFIKKITWLDIDENKWWIDMDVNMNAKDFLKVLKSKVI